MRKSFYSLKVVRTRKAHVCIVCGEIIPKRTRTLVENGFNHDEGFFTNYFHINEKMACHLDYLDCQQPNDLTMRDKIEDPKMFGELMFNKWRE